MAAAEVVARARDGRLEDLVCEAVALVAQELMEAEVRWTRSSARSIRKRG
jgi:hypothetical protein